MTGYLQSTGRLNFVASPAQVLKCLVSCRPYGSWTTSPALISCLSRPHAAASMSPLLQVVEQLFLLQATQQLESVQKSMKGPMQQAQHGLSGLTDQLFHRDQKVGQQTG